MTIRLVAARWREAIRLVDEGGARDDTDILVAWRTSGRPRWS
ncbi:MAG TPA: hypothetical protein VFV89_00530 [Nocardioides sp.]|nr:hypothetical protein [Nocardioides sp.]HEX5086263.1 hypothetical protein [Nocardioides sp.]